MNTALGSLQKVSPQARGYFICLAGTTLWSFTAIFIRYLMVNSKLLPLAFWRDLFVFLCLGIFFLLFSPRLLKVERTKIRFLAVYGLVLSLFNSIWTISVAMNGAAVSTVLAYSSGGITALIGWRLFRERLDAIKIAAILLSLSGTVLVAGAWQADAWATRPFGILVGLLSGLGLAGYSLMGRAAAIRKINPWSALFYSFGFASLLLLGYNLLLTPLFPDGLLAQVGTARGLFALGFSLVGWSVLVSLAAGPTIGGYGLYTVSLGYLPASVANLIATLEPAMTAAWAFVFLSERLGTAQLIGSLLILIAVMLIRFQKEGVVGG